MIDIHPTASVSPRAALSGAVRVGPFAVIEAGAELGAGVEVQAHAVVHGAASLAEDVTVGVHAVVGGDPQDLSFDPRMPTRVEVGAGTTLREGAIVHRSTGEVPTRVGRDCLLMGSTHVAHDCWIGDGVVISQATVLGGHVQVDDHAVLGGAAAIHQHVRIGRLAMVGGTAKVTQDVLPFTLVDGSPAMHWRPNSVGLRRHEVPAAEHAALRRAFLALQRGEATLEGDGSVLVADLLAFRSIPSMRGISDFARRARLTAKVDA